MKSVQAQRGALTQELQKLFDGHLSSLLALKVYDESLEMVTKCSLQLNGHGYMNRERRLT